MDNPFGALEFLHWDHPWNSHKYSCRKNLEKAALLMNEAGLSWVRTDFLWGDIELKQGEFDFKKYDVIVEVFNKHRVNILGLLNYSADWANKDGKWNYPPEDNSLFIKYAKATALRYKGKVKFWEVWNEPDSTVYWAKQDGLKSYCVLLREAYAALKNIDPGCKVLNGGLANGIESLKQFYENGPQDCFDILNLHFFESPLHEGGIKAVEEFPRLAYAVMKKFGDAHKKIWVTETGCPGVGSGVKTGDWWIGENPDEDKQAEWLREVFIALLKDSNVEKVFWAFFRDCKGHWNDGVDYFGLVRWDFSCKPAFNALREFIASKR